MLDRWKKLSRGERLRVRIVVVMLVLGFYGLVFYPVSHGNLQESIKMLNRRKDRIEKRTKLEGLPMTGVSPRTIEQKIEEVEQRLQEVARDFDELDTGFAPVDSSEVRQQLLLEISTLAARTGVKLLSVSRKGVSPKGERIRAPVDPVLGRPLLIVRANARYGQLIDFLHGLKDLSFHVSVMNLKLYSRPSDDAGRETIMPEGVLYVILEMSM